MGSMPPPGALKPPQPNVAPAAGTPSFNGMPQHSSPQYSMQSPRGPVPHPHLSGNFSPTGPPTTVEKHQFNTGRQLGNHILLHHHMMECKGMDLHRHISSTFNSLQTAHNHHRLHLLKCPDH